MARSSCWISQVLTWCTGAATTAPPPPASALCHHGPRIHHPSGNPSTAQAALGVGEVRQRVGQRSLEHKVDEAEQG